MIEHLSNCHGEWNILLAALGSVPFVGVWARAKIQSLRKKSQIMKVGDLVKVKGRPEFGAGKIVRFYANQGTILIQLPKEGAMIYCDYSEVENDEAR